MPSPFPGMDPYLEHPILWSGVHQGIMTYARAELNRLLPEGYVVSLHRGGDGPRYAVWAVTVRQRLPRITVPLADGDPDVVLDLPAVFDRCYDEGPYARRIDYGGDPHHPLKSPDADWVKELLAGRTGPP